MEKFKGWRETCEMNQCVDCKASKLETFWNINAEIGSKEHSKVFSNFFKFFVFSYLCLWSFNFILLFTFMNYFVPGFRIIIIFIKIFCYAFFFDFFSDFILFFFIFYPFFMFSCYFLFYGKCICLNLNVVHHQALSVVSFSFNS